jgi:hypothetical protein
MSISDSENELKNPTLYLTIIEEKNPNLAEPLSNQPILFRLSFLTPFLLYFSKSLTICNVCNWQ